MNDCTSNEMICAFQEHIKDPAFPCLAAHSALANGQIRYCIVDHMACPHDDNRILVFLYQFIDELRSNDNSFFSAVVIFTQPESIDEKSFEYLFWSRLQSLADMDAKLYPYDARVDSNIQSPTFSFSLKEEAFYIIGLHAGSSRKARRFAYPAMVFNAHAQFEKLREENHYIKMQDVVRSRDLEYSGSVNPMLSDFGVLSEAFQYTGSQYNMDWKCPLKINHARTDHHSST